MIASQFSLLSKDAKGIFELLNNDSKRLFGLGETKVKVKGVGEYVPFWQQQACFVQEERDSEMQTLHRLIIKST